MNQHGHVNKVSKNLKSKRFSNYYSYILHGKSVGRYGEKYEEVMWNSGDIQFLALWMRKSGQRKPYFEICIDFFGYFYSMWTRNHDNTVKRQDGIVIRDEKVASLRDFLLIKPTDETFTIPSYKGDYHLSFGKRSLLGGIELRWRFLHSQEEWGHAHQLPRKERKDVLKKFKQKEQRQQLWFDDTQIKKLSYYLDGLLSLQD